MSVRLFYVDESFDDAKFCLTGLAVKHRLWKECLDGLRGHRSWLKAKYGIPMRVEIHARDLVAGRGSLGVAPNAINKWERSRIFLGMLQLIARLPVMAFNVCLDSKGVKDVHLRAWDRLLNRIERTMLEFENQEAMHRGKLLTTIPPDTPVQAMDDVRKRLEAFCPRAIVISDEGHEDDMTKAARRMHVFNPIPSQYGQWSQGQRSKNIATERIIEDPVFRDSSRSYFLQLADCVAFALLKREVPPTKNIAKYNIHKMFDATVAARCFRPASPRDPLGIVRA